MEIEVPLEWDLIVTGRKTELRSPKPLLDPDVEGPCMVMLHHNGKYVPFVLEEVWREELADVTESDAVAEGFDSLASFKRHWVSKTGVVHFSPVERVWGYALAGPWDPDDFARDHMKTGSENSSFATAVLALVDYLYPTTMK
jgi:hypothetical protein